MKIEMSNGPHRMKPVGLASSADTRSFADPTRSHMIKERVDDETGLVREISRGRSLTWKRFANPAYASSPPLER